MAAPPAWGFEDLHPAQRLVLAHGLPGARIDRCASLSDEEWARLVEASRRHGLEGLLVAAVVDDALPLDAARRSDAAELELELTKRRMGHEARSLSPLGALDDAGIDLRLLKGPALAALDYPDPQQRPTGDLDLLVRADEIDRAVAVLLAAGGTWIDPEPTAGYVRLAGKGATVRMSDGLEVDLHRILIWGPFGVRMPGEELWANPRPFTFAGVPRQGLGLEEALLHVALHLLVLGMVRAREVRDVGQLLCSPQLDAERLLVLARRWGQEAVLATAVLMAGRELRLERESHPLSAWATGFPVTARDRLWLRTEQPVGRLRGLESAAVYAELPSAAARQILRKATLHPRPGTWPGPRDRLVTLGRRLTKRA